MRKSHHIYYFIVSRSVIKSQTELCLFPGSTLIIFIMQLSNSFVTLGLNFDGRSINFCFDMNDWEV